MRPWAVGCTGLAVTATAALAAAANAPAATTSPAPGIYVEQAPPASEARLEKVEASRPTRTGVKVVFSGARSSERLPSTPMFQFHFDAAASPTAASRPNDIASMMSMMATMESGSDMPAGVTRPQDFALVRLQTKGEEREMEASSDMKPSRKQTVACRVRQLGPHVFRVAPEQPLPPGEYGFVALPKGGGMDRLWDFGVDPDN